MRNVDISLSDFAMAQKTTVSQDSRSRSKRENVLRLFSQGFSPLECARRTYGGTLPDEMMEGTSHSLSFEGDKSPLARMRQMFARYCQQVEHWIKQEEQSC